MLVAIVAGAVIALAPILQVISLDVRDGLSDGGSNASGGRRQRHLRQAAVGIQVTLTLVPLGAAGILARSLRFLQCVDVGYDADHLLVATLDFDGAVRRGIAASRILTSTQDVSPDFFNATGIRVTRGRAFTTADGPGAPPSTIVTATTAQRWWPGENPIGKRFKIGGVRSPYPWMTVVGVTANAHEVNDWGHSGTEVRHELDTLAPDLPVDAAQSLRRVMLAGGTNGGLGIVAGCAARRIFRGSVARAFVGATESYAQGYLTVSCVPERSTTTLSTEHHA